jgi:membrane protease YdiL (CAAX protease family)
MQSRNETRPAWPAWYGLAAFAVALVATSLIAAVLAPIVGHTSGNNSSKAFVLAISFVQDIALVVCAVWLAGRTARPTPAQFGIRPAPLRRVLKWSGIGVLIYIVFQAIYVAAVHPHDQTTLKDLGGGKGMGYTIFIGFFVVAVGPVVEEFFFRGFLYGSFRTRLSFLPAALFAGLIFGAVHALTGPQAIPPLAVLGFCFCLIYEATGSILPTMVLHSLNNMLAFGSDKYGNWAVSVACASLVLIGCVTVAVRSRTLT